MTPNRLELPDDLALLIEKREQEDRRDEERHQAEAQILQDRRSGEDRRIAPRREDDPA